MSDRRLISKVFWLIFCLGFILGQAAVCSGDEWALGFETQEEKEKSQEETQDYWGLGYQDPRKAQERLKLESDRKKKLRPPREEDRPDPWDWEFRVGHPEWGETPFRPEAWDLDAAIKTPPGQDPDDDEDSDSQETFP